jgi:pimeloyl-ACP methyl ester carboxylesterase/ketosteroid isomerase-like protein
MNAHSSSFIVHRSSFIVMKKLIVLLLVALPALADAATDVRSAEIAFAKAFADRDAAKFFSFVADDATFLSARGTLNGKAEIVKRWSEFFKSKEAPFSWRPERVVVADAGKLGLSSGPVFDSEGIQVGIYSSVWEKQVDGSWKVKFDGPGAPPPVEEGFITTPDGVKLHYRKTGHGPTTIVVPLEHLLWDETSKLADQATVISYDMRSRGRSSRTEAISIQNDAADLETVRKHFNLDRFVPVGYSYLGMMVALYARDHPDRVERLVQIAPLAMTSAEREARDIDPPSPPKELVAKHELMLKSGAIDSQPREFCEVDAKLFAYTLVGDPLHADRIPIHCELENEWPKYVWHTFKLLMSGPPVTLTPKDISHVTVPVLVIHGTKDRTAPYAGGVTWSKSWPHAKLVTVEGAAHGVLWEEPERVLGAIRELIRN